MSVYKESKTNTWKFYYRYTDWQGDMTFKSFVEVYTTDVKSRIKENTWHTKEHIIRTKLLPYFGKRKIAEIQPIRAVGRDILAKLALGVGSVGEDGRPLEVDLADQFFSNSDVSSVASGQHDRYGVAQSVYSSVNLRASATSTDANALIDLGFVYTNLPI